MPAKGDGSSKRKDGRYMARYTVQTPDGPKLKTIYGRKYKEVEKKLAEARGDAARGLVFDADNLKLGEYLDRWLTNSVADTVRPTTFERYEQIVRLHIRLVLRAPKTKASRRTVKLSPTALEALRSHLERQLGEIDQAGDLWSENGLIFASESGEPLKRHYITTYLFKPLLKRAGLPQIRFHDLRHTRATLLLIKNVNPKVVSEMLGHSSIAITLDTYSHVLPNMQSEAAKAMEDALT